MAENNFMDKIRTFFGFGINTPRNDFRNPIWSSDDEDDGDELYTKHPMAVFEEELHLHEEFSKQMHDMIKSFGTIFGDIKSFMNDIPVDSFTSMAIAPPEQDESDSFNSNSIRDYYLKPGYHNHQEDHKDMDLDGKISSNEISGLLKQKKDAGNGPIMPFNGKLIPGRSFCKTIITTSVTKSDGTVETRRIVKNGNEVIEETTTTTPSGISGMPMPGLDHNPGLIYNHVMSELSSLFRNFY